MDIVISTALIPEKPAPILIDKTMVEKMKAGSAIIDLAAANGGNCELTKPNEIIMHNGITIDGMTNLPGTMPLHASTLYSKNLNNLFSYIFKDDSTDLDLDDEIIDGAMLFYKGKVNNEYLQNIIKKDN